MCTFLLLLTTVWALAYLRLPLVTSTAVAAAVLLGWSLFGTGGPWGLAVTWIFFLGIAIPLNSPVLRRRLLSDRAFTLFKSVLPHMSRTEREALEAGTVWWDGELFSGKPRWERLLALPPARLTPEEQAFVAGPVEELCRMLDDWRITQQDLDLPEPVWRFLKEKGFFGMIIPKEFCGLGFSALAHSTVVSKIATRSLTSAVTVMVPNSLGPAELLLHYGTKAQKEHYLPRLARGEEVPCFALTSPEAGSDASGMPDKGVVCRGMHNGEETLGIRVTWDKRYITLGPVATVLGLAFRLYDPEHLLGDKHELGITCALIPTSHPGVEIGLRHFPLNTPFQNGPTRGRDVFIPMEWVIGGPEQAGHGWRMLMECLAAGRSISLPALSTGAGKLASRAIGAYARVRRQFKSPIGRFEGVEEALARIAGNTYVMEAARTLTTRAIDAGEKPSVVSAIVKYNLTERMRKVVNDAMDVQGGAGICLGPRNFIGRAYQAIPISITVEGANILTRTLIIFGQGAIRCHPHVLKEMQAVHHANPEHGRAAFDQALFAHIGFSMSNAARALALGLTGARLVHAPVRGPAGGYFRQLSRMSAAFALAADVAMLTLGGSLKRREKLSGRLADVLSQLYLASAALKRYVDDGMPEHDLPLLRWACEDALYTSQQQLDGLITNLPSRPAAWVLRALIFPLGRRYTPPSDRVGHAAARLLLTPSEARDRLTAGIYLPVDEHEQLARLERAMQLAVDAEAVEHKLRHAGKKAILDSDDLEANLAAALAEGLITAPDAETVREAVRVRRDVVQVDEFAPEELCPGIKGVA